MGRLQKDNIPVHSVMLNWAGLNCVLDGMMLNRMVLDRMMGGTMVAMMCSCSAMSMCAMVCSMIAMVGPVVVTARTIGEYQRWKQEQQVQSCGHLALCGFTDALPPMCAHLYMRGDVKEGGGLTFASRLFPSPTQIRPLYLRQTTIIRSSFSSPLSSLSDPLPLFNLTLF